MSKILGLHAGNENKGGPLEPSTSTVLETRRNTLPHIQFLQTFSTFKEVDR